MSQKNSDLPKNSILLLKHLAEDICAICKEETVYESNIPFTQTKQEDLAYLLKRVESQCQFLHRQADVKELVNELFRLASWAIAAALPSYKCKMVFAKLAKILHPSSNLLPDENLFMVCAILSDEGERYGLHAEGNELPTRVLSAIFREDTSLSFENEALWGDALFWKEAYLAYCKKDTEAIRGVLHSLADCWMEDRAFDTFLLNNKYFSFYELYPNALCYLLQKKLRWKLQFDKKEYEDFYLPALWPSREQIPMVQQLHIQQGILFYDGENEPIALNDGGFSDALLLVQSVLAQVIRLTDVPDFQLVDLHYKACSFYDYCELYVEQVDRDTMSIYSQFYDGSDRREIRCDARLFYKEYLRSLDFYFAEIEADASRLASENQMYERSFRKSFAAHKREYLLFKERIGRYYWGLEG